MKKNLMLCLGTFLVMFLLTFLVGICGVPTECITKHTTAFFIAVSTISLMPSVLIIGITLILKGVK